MRDYGRVFGTFWSSLTTGALSDDARLLALYLLTCPHSTIAGVFRLPDGYVADDLKWSVERVRERFGELLANGFATRCETTKWVWVVKHLKWNPPDNPNQRKAAAKVAASVPAECTWKRAFYEACGPALGLGALPEPGTIQEPLAQPLANQEQEQEQEQKKPRKPRTRTSTIPDDFGISNRVKAWAAEKGFDRLPEHLESFRSKAVAKGYTYADWDEGFMGAIRADWAGLRQVAGHRVNGTRQAALDCEEQFR